MIRSPFVRGLVTRAVRSGSSSEVIWRLASECLLGVRKRTLGAWTHFFGSVLDPQTSTREPSLPAKHNPLQHFFSELGPGLITGCADDDPSGISAVQLMCGRLGMVTGRGLAGVVRLHYPR
jgi:hypothetical protein